MSSVVARMPIALDGIGAGSFGAEERPFGAVPDDSRRLASLVTRARYCALAAESA